jgi:DNA-binding CsgD family transcriptional regulator
VTTGCVDSLDSLPRLSSRQEQCIRGVLDLKSAKVIARELGISQHAVEKHLKVVRAKFGVDTTVEAARLFALAREGKDFQQYGFSDLAERCAAGHSTPVHEQPHGWSGDQNGALLLDAPLTPRQTLLTIAAVCFASIVGLLLLVACAEGIRALVSS